MIPKIIPPLTGLSVLVTRPAGQAEALCAAIERHGGTALHFPTIAIEPLEAPSVQACDLAVFVSVNAVQHGKHLIANAPATRIAAIGKATAAALQAAGLRVDYVPSAGFTSEDLLNHPDLQLTPGMRAMIIRGEGGRELLHDTFVARGMTVEMCNVYRRVQPALTAEVRDALETRWADGEVDIVTATSVTTLEYLQSMLSDSGRALLRSTPLLVISDRIAKAARAAGIEAEIIVATADEASIVGALARWRTRAREPVRRREPEINAGT